MGVPSPEGLLCLQLGTCSVHDGEQARGEGPRVPVEGLASQGSKDRPSGGLGWGAKGHVGHRGGQGGGKEEAFGKRAHLYLENLLEGLPPSCPQTLAHEVP